MASKTLKTLKAVKDGREKNLAKHHDILSNVDANTKISTFALCCSCIWIHDGDFGAIPNVKELKQNSVDPSYVIDPKQLRLGQVLGRGGNGCVYVASYCGFPVAVKELLEEIEFSPTTGNEGVEQKLEQALENGDENQKKNDEFTREFQNLKRIRHPHVVDLYGTALIEQPDTHTFRRLLVMELASCSLRDVLRNENNLAPMGSALMWAQQVASGLAFLHSRGLIHFDIKPANVLLDMSGKAKICDLGVARATSLHTPSSMTFTNSARAGTPSFMAPELLRGDVARITNTIDVYSFGILLWEVVHREPPHPKTWTLPVLFKQVTMNKFRPEIESDVPEGLAQLIRLCWNDNPDERPSCDTIADILSYLAPKQMPKLISTDDDDGEPFCIWYAEAKCFLSDCRFHKEQNGLCEIDFDDGQPTQEGVDPRNIVLMRGIDSILNGTDHGQGAIPQFHHDQAPITDMAPRFNIAADDDDSEEDSSSDEDDDTYQPTRVTAFLNRILNKNK